MKLRVNILKTEFIEEDSGSQNDAFPPAVHLPRRKCSWISVIVKVVQSVLHSMTILIFDI